MPPESLLALGSFVLIICNNWSHISPCQPRTSPTTSTTFFYNSFFTTLRPLASLQPSSQHILGTTDISRPSKLSTHSLGSSWASCFRWLEVSNLLSCLVSQIVPIKIGSQIANARTTTTRLLMCIYPHLCKWCLLYLLSENHVLDISGFLFFLLFASSWLKRHCPTKQQQLPIKRRHSWHDQFWRDFLRSQSISPAMALFFQDRLKCLLSGAKTNKNRRWKLQVRSVYYI